MASLFRSVTVLVAVVGLGLTWIAMDHAVRPLVMFTVQSNLMLVAYGALRVVRGGPGSAGIKGAVTLYMLVTGLIWHFLRMGGANPFDDLGLDLGLGNFLLHYVTPALALVDWLFLDRDVRAPRWRAALAWLAYPAAYLVFALVRGALLPPDAWKRYPYPFLDADRLGYDGLAFAVTGLTLGFAALGLILVALRRAAPQPVAAAPAASDRSRSSDSEPDSAANMSMP